MRIIAGKYKRRKLFTPKGIQTRPSTDRLRETLMAILEGGRFGFPLNSNLIIDVFAGTGALGIEAASRGHPNKVIFIEKNSNDKIKTMITLRARPSMPSIKFIELIIATIINIVNSCDANRPNS